MTDMDTFDGTPQRRRAMASLALVMGTVFVVMGVVLAFSKSSIHVGTALFGLSVFCVPALMELRELNTPRDARVS